MLKSTSLYEKVYQHLKQQICDGVFPIDTPVFESQLAEQLGVSRTPIREAVRILKSEGLLEQLSGGGIRAYPITPTDLNDAGQVRIALEATTVRLATARMTDAQFEELNRILVRAQTAIKHGFIDETMQANEAFHRFIAAATGSRLIEQLLDRIYDFIKTNNVLTGIAAHQDVTMLMQAFYEEHLAIMNAMQAKDSDLAVKLMQQHLSDVNTRYQTVSNSSGA